MLFIFGSENRNILGLFPKLNGLNGFVRSRVCKMCPEALTWAKTYRPVYSIRSILEMMNVRQCRHYHEPQTKTHQANIVNYIAFQQICHKYYYYMFVSLLLISFSMNDSNQKCLLRKCKRHNNINTYANKQHPDCMKKK